MKEIKTQIETQIQNNQQSLRPLTFEDYIGQSRIVENVKTSISAAKLKKKPLGHILFYGPPGLGKTTMAGIIANEMGVNLRTVSAPNIEKQGEMAAILSSLQEGDILFIDEIHRLPKFVEEILYSAMEDYRIDVLIGEGQQTKTVMLPLPVFTLIGATTKAGMVSAPLRDRFEAIYNLEYYSVDDLAKIALRTSKTEQTKLDMEAAEVIAEAGRGTPRIVNNLTRRVCDYLLANNKNGKKKEIMAALSAIGIDSKGLSLSDRRYLDCLKNASGKPVGLKTISSYLGETTDTIAEDIEPYLIRKGFVQILPRGRFLTEKYLEAAI